MDTSSVLSLDKLGLTKDKIKEVLIAHGIKSKADLEAKAKENNLSVEDYAKSLFGANGCGFVLTSGIIVTLLVKLIISILVSECLSDLADQIDNG